MPQPPQPGVIPGYPPTSSYPPSTGYGAFPPYPSANNLPYPSYNNAPYPIPYSSYGGPIIPGCGPASGGTGTIKDEHIRESLLTAIEEKLMRRMKEQFQQNQAELDTLKRTQDELKQGSSKLNSILSRLEKEKVSYILFE